MAVKIASGSELRRERTFINSNGQEVSAEQFFGGDVKFNMGTHPGVKGLPTSEKKSS